METAAKAIPKKIIHKTPNRPKLKAKKNDPIFENPPELGMPAADFFKCYKVLESLKRHPSYSIFSSPVTPSPYHCPDYLDVIKKPMDFGTIRHNLTQGLYTSINDFKNDCQLVFHNCYQYNRPGEPVYVAGQRLEAKFSDLWRVNVEQNVELSGTGKVKTAVLSDADLQKMSTLIRELITADAYTLFSKPVDPISLNIPNYFDVITHPMDFGTIQQKLSHGIYKDLISVANDIALVFQNSFCFNGAQDVTSESSFKDYFVYVETVKLRHLFEERWRVLVMGDFKLDLLRMMSDLSIGKCRSIINNVKQLDYTNPFLLPIDENQFANYREYIWKPICLKDIERKLTDDRYISAMEFSDDFRLMLNNAFTYNMPEPNQPKNGIFLMAERLLHHFDNEWFNEFMNWNNVNDGGDDITVNSPPVMPFTEVLTKNATMTTLEAIASPTVATVNEKDVPIVSDVTDASQTAMSFFDVQLSRIVERLWNNAHSELFRYPVNPVADGVPDYFEKIKHPMDLSTIKQKVNRKQYPNANIFNNDVEQIFKNCFLYHSPGIKVVAEAQALQRNYRKFWPVEKRRLDAITSGKWKVWARETMKTLRSHPNAFPFNAPVDPFALNIPNYFDIVTRPMDFRTISEKLEKDSGYDAIDNFLADVQLVFDNCFLFNGNDHVFSGYAHTLEALMRAQLKKL